MSWGTGPWGTGSPWGIGTVLPPPTLIGVSSQPGPTAQKANPAVIARRGGTVCTAFGTNFFTREERPFIDVELLAGSVGSYEVVGTGYVFDFEFDILRNKVFFGTPSLQDGLYHLRIRTDGGESGVLENVIEARLFAEEYKTISVRGKYAPVWKTGPRFLREG